MAFKRYIWLACLGAGLTAAAPASATTATDPNVAPQAAPGERAELEARRAALFQQMLADVSNLEIAFEYAALSARLGDLEGAVSTLERMLIFAPGLPRLQLELGILYHRLGAYETAESYFDAALSSPNVTEELVAAIEPYRRVIAKRTAVNRFEGAVVVGARYQTNANAGPSSRFVNLNGFEFQLDETATSREDINAFVAGSFRYSRDLANQGDSFDVSLQTYGALYAESDEINTALAEVTFGPNIDLARFGLSGASLQLYGIAAGVVLDEDPYLLSGGVGIGFASLVGAQTRLSLKTEYRREDYRDSDLRPFSSDRSGDRIRAVATAERLVTDRFSVFAQFEGERRESAVDIHSLWEVGGAIGGTWRFTPFDIAGGEAWALSLSGRYLHRRHDDPDPIISFAEEQEDHETAFQAALSVPLGTDWAVQTIAGYRNVVSNYDTRHLDNISATVGVMRRF